MRLSVLFDKVLMPLLINVFFPMFKSVCKFAFDIICGVLFRIYVTILHFVDILANIFNIFGGIQNVIPFSSLAFESAFRTPEFAETPPDSATVR